MVRFVRKAGEQMNDVFRAGVAPGGLTMDYEIKVLICYILDQVEEPIPISALIEVFVGQGIGNYFEVTSAASQLVKNNHLCIDTDENGCKRYEITKLGKNAAKTFEKNIPLSVRERAVAAAKRYLTVEHNKKYSKTNIQKVPDGYEMTLTITDVGSDLLTVKLLLPTMEVCRQVQERFLEDPLVIYKGVVALVTGSFDNIGPLVEG
ncbi:DUF4364 family protein [Youxingia wuxianensis]|uniref:DUF4364 family protein n=1 Tax=Youxingia wuxianensis TaxID=2763678 RepID=A0A926EIS7_9FIRM|nr:DUF4364 family protein [Youxingia wuxianensis]MBC8584133.1 DUF4364 family protein [Youxingia wuxianensis]